MGYDTNMVVLQGRLTRDPDVKYTQDGKAIANFSIAVGSGKDKANFFEVTAWEKKADFAQSYLKKGSAVIVTGSLSQQTWNDKDSGAKRSKVVVIAQGITFQAGGKKEDAGDPAPTPYGQTYPAEPKSEAELALDKAGLTGSNPFNDEDCPF